MNSHNIKKYQPFPKIDLPDRQWPGRVIEKAPVWCSVDLRDGNQALAIPMNVHEKMEMFELLLRIGFKQIEVGFPSASDTEYRFLRRLIEEGRVPEDVTLQVLVQAREHLIRRTFESLQGANKAIVHLYNSTSPLQRRVTFSNASKEDIRKIAEDGTRLVRELAPTLRGTDLHFQYSPESFSDTELDFSHEVCRAVMDAWQPTVDKPIILNLPATVEWTTPNVHADQIEWFCRQLEKDGVRDQVLVSLHTHNDRGTGVAATELALLAGADRVEGTLFGNGERTGNVDIVTVAINMNSHGLETGLDFSDLPAIRDIYERCTRMSVPDRQPYGGDLVFTAFSGSHQDAIKKGMDIIRQRERDAAASSAPVRWQVPYLTIDPQDIGRNYEAIIRINSQSGKGGVAYVLDREFGFDLPKTLHPDVGEVVNRMADSRSTELSAAEILSVFKEHFVNIGEPLKLIHFKEETSETEEHSHACVAKVSYQGSTEQIRGSGNGPINAFVHAMEQKGWKNFKVTDYRSHAIGEGSAVDSAAYVRIQHGESGAMFWGCGLDPSIELAGLKALVSAYNRLLSHA